MPLVVKASTTPLLVKVVLLNQFPAVPPILVVMAEVVHDDICSKSMQYTGKHIREWNMSSNLCQLLYKLTYDFDVKAPIPKALIAAQKP